MHDIQLKILDQRMQDIQLTKGTDQSAGYDLHACIDQQITLAPNHTHKIPSGIAIYMADPSMAALILPRSSWGCKGLILANTIGLIDADYQGQIFMMMSNRSQTDITINPLDRIAQLIFINVLHPKLESVKHFPATVRGEQGFGSTGS